MCFSRFSSCVLRAVRLPPSHGSRRETASRELMPAVTHAADAVASLPATGRWTSRAQAPDGNRTRKRTGHAAADSPLKSGSPGHPSDCWLPLERPRRRAVRQHSRWRARLPREPSTDRDGGLARASLGDLDPAQAPTCRHQLISETHPTMGGHYGLPKITLRNFVVWWHDSRAT